MALEVISNPGQLVGLAIALALGLLVGVQRGWALRGEQPGTRFAGIRTYGLLGLAGGVGGVLAGISELYAGEVMFAAAAVILVGYWRTTQRGGSISGTGSVAGLLTLASGFLAGTGAMILAVAIAVPMVLLLSMRSQLHGLVARLSETEVLAVARFALMAAVVLPLLPDRRFGPLEAWNPRQLWLVVVLVSGFSFAGYVAARLLGPSRGTIATAAAGSVVSSTAVTAALANRLKDAQEEPSIMHAGIAAASAVMFARVTTLVALLAPFALEPFIVLSLPGLVVSALFAVLFLWHARTAHRGEARSMEVKNPFDIGPALLLMALVMATTLAARWVLQHYGNAGLATVLAITGSVDVDSAIITMGNLPQGSLTPQLAALVLLPPILLNTLFKAGDALSISGWKRAWPAAAALAVSGLDSIAAVPLVL
ncbi:MAG: MgtC/SapB family protein [Novosphingobium sp.]